MKYGAKPSFAPRTPQRLTFLLIFVGGLLLWQPSIRSGLLWIIRWPFSAATHVVTAVLLLPQLPSVAHENLALKAALAQERTALAAARDTVRHTEEGAALLRAISPRPGMLASIIGRSIIPTQRTILLDRGSRNGLSLTTIVVDASGVIGRLTDVHATTSFVMLLTDPDSRVAGLIERSRESGLLIGQGTGRCLFTYLDADADIQPQDRILTAGLGGTFPKGLLLGIVESVDRDLQAGTTSANVKPAARLSALEQVVCLTDR